MKQIIEFTKNWRYRNILHIIVGCMLAVVPNIFLNEYIGAIVGIIICILIANYWELQQVKHFSATYSIKDVMLTVLGGITIGVIFKLI